MADTYDLRAASERLDALLRELEAHGDPAARHRVAEIVDLLMTLHRAALERLVGLAANPASGGPALLNQIADDPIAGPMLLVHDLHPYALDVRLSRAVERLRPLVAARGCRLEIAGVELPTVHVTVKGLANLDAAAGAALRELIERALLECAPELAGVVFDAQPGDVVASALIQITKPEDYAATAPIGTDR